MVIKTKEQFNRIKMLRHSSRALILANLVPLGGVLFFEWSFLDVLLVYVIETGVIGFYNIFKLLLVKTDEEHKEFPLMRYYTRFFNIVFFSAHFSAMVFLLGTMIYLVVSLFSGGHIDMKKAIREDWPGIISLFASHGYSFKKNFIDGKESEKTTARILMIQPYLRLLWVLLILFLGAAAGGVLMMRTGTGIFFIIIFILLKIIVDLASHEMERKKFSVAEKIDAGIRHTEEGIRRFPVKIVKFIMDKFLSGK